MENVFFNKKGLETQQEKDLEQEREEQAQKYRTTYNFAAIPTFDERLNSLVEGKDVDNTIKAMKRDNVLLSIGASLSNTKMSKFCNENKNAWAAHLLVTKDFSTVISNTQLQQCDDFLRSVQWVAFIKVSTKKYVLIILSTFECNKLLPVFRKSTNAILYMYNARLYNHQSNLINDYRLRITAMDENND